MAIITRHTGKGLSYLVRVRDNEGEWFESKSFARKIDARDYEAELLALKRKGTRATSRNNRTRTVLDFWVEWDSKRTTVSDGWLLSQRQMWRDHIPAPFKNKRLIEVGPPDVMGVLAFAKEKGLGAQMQLHVYRMLHQMFYDAVELYDYLNANPVRDRLRPSVPKVSREFFKPEQAKAFLEAVRDEWLGPGIWIMIYNALRVGELQMLQHWNVDLKGGSMTLTQQWQRKLKRAAPLNNGQPVHLPMAPRLVEYLIEKRPRDYTPDDFVIPGKSGGMLSYDTFEDGLKRLCKKYGFPELSPHELRHTSTELWFDAGASQEDVRRLLNHSSESAIKSYIHKTPERLARIAQGMDQKKVLKLVKSE
jgi:integrase